MTSKRIQANPRDMREGTTTWRSTPRPVDWEARVAAVKRRDVSCRWIENDAFCESTTDLECDHINNPADHSLANLRMLCRVHHRRRTGQQAGQASAAARARRPRLRPPEPHPGLIT